MVNARLRELRKEKGLTQEDMALALGYKDKSSYCLIENGKSRVTVDIANKIATVLNLSSAQTQEIFFKCQV